MYFIDHWLQIAENGSMDFQDVSKFSYDQLTVPSEELPPGVDPSCREVGNREIMTSTHLSHVFLDICVMTLMW
jgi:hypothetical protein